jgi:hypothetical protein
VRIGGATTQKIPTIDSDYEMMLLMMMMTMMKML